MREDGFCFCQNHFHFAKKRPGSTGP